MFDAGRAFNLYTEQKLAGRRQWPRLAVGKILLLINAPDGGGRRLRSSAARADAELVGPSLVVGKAAGTHELANGVRRLRLAEQDAMGAARQDLAELPGVEGNVGAVRAVD